MSIPVALTDLAGAIEGYGFAYLLTVSDDLRSHLLAVVPRRDDDGSFVVAVGRGTAHNITDRPAVALVYPPHGANDHSLIVDVVGVIEEDDEVVLARLRPERAVLHRPAPPPVPR